MDSWRQIFSRLSNNLLSDKDFVIKVIQKLPDLYKYIPRKLKRDKDIYLLATLHLAQADKQLRIDQDLNLQKSLNDTFSYNSLFHTLKSNKEFVLKALEKGACIWFRSLHSELKKDRDIVMWYLKKEIEDPANSYFDHYQPIKKELLFDSELLELYIKEWSHLLPKYSFGKEAIPILKNKACVVGQKCIFGVFTKRPFE